nr:hypothetical protein HmN_000711000 [Hymenolepis microstoma]
MKEVDTELFQIDKQELSKELPDLVNDSNSIHGDIHNFSPKRSTTSTTRCDKHERKAIKPRAAYQQILSKPVPQHRSPKHQPLLWRLTIRQPYLIHANPLLASKHCNLQGQNTVSSTTVTVPINLRTF